MPKYYCDYCKILLKHSSPFGRKQHNSGKKHIFNKIEYFNSYLLEYEKNQKQSRMIGGPPPPMMQRAGPPPMEMRGPPPPMFDR